VGAWVNSAKSLWLLPAFVCVVFGPMVQHDLWVSWVKFCTIVAAVAGFVCVVFGPMVQRDLWVSWVKFCTIVAAVASFVCVVFGPMVQCNFVGDNHCNVSCFNFWPTASCTPRVQCLAQRLCIPRQCCALSMGLENKKLDGSLVVGWCGCGCQVCGWLWCCMTDLAQSWHS